MERYQKDTTDYCQNKEAERCPLCGKGAHLRRATNGDGHFGLIWAHGEDDMGEAGILIVDSCSVYIWPGKAVFVQSGEREETYVYSPER